ncbi:MAG: class I SAM-dependent methyltransferase [Gemmatimonadota bacterium]
MGLYSRFVLPRLVHLACGTKPAMRQRYKIVPEARGRVLEIGLGSGLNLPIYDPDRVEHVFGLEPSPEMAHMAEARAVEAPFDVEPLEADAEEIPLEDASVDTVLVTYTLCTIPDAEAAVREMARVLKPSGRLLFCEHGAAPDAAVRKWQDRLDGVWGRLAGGCHLNRDIPALITEGGFALERLDTMYIPGWRPVSFNYWGSAAPHRAGG